MQYSWLVLVQGRGGVHSSSAQHKNTLLVGGSARETARLDACYNTSEHPALPDSRAIMRSDLLSKPSTQVSGGTRAVYEAATQLQMPACLLLIERWYRCSMVQDMELRV